MIDTFVLFVKKRAIGEDGGPTEETLFTVNDSSLEVMIKRYHNMAFENKLVCDDIEFVEDEKFSSGRIIKFNVYAR